MELPIDENWRIKTDTNQWIVQKKTLVNKDKQEYEWRSQSYHMTLEQAVRSLGNRLLRESPAVTPMGRNHFYELYTMAALGDAPDFKAWHFTSRDNPLLDPSEIEVARKTLSSYAFRQEYEASFEARGSEMFKESWVSFSEEEPKGGQWLVAIDLAGFEEVGKKAEKRLDDTSIAIVKVSPEGWWVKEIISGRWTLKETASVIFGVVKE